MTGHFGEKLGRACWRELARKRLDTAAVAALNAQLEERWGEIRARIGAITTPVSMLESVLLRVGAPTTPEDLNWPRGFYHDAVRHAREIRDRYTFLDLAADSGQLDGGQLVGDI